MTAYIHVHKYLYPWPRHCPALSGYIQRARVSHHNRPSLRCAILSDPPSSTLSHSSIIYRLRQVVCVSESALSNVTHPIPFPDRVGTNGARLPARDIPVPYHAATLYTPRRGMRTATAASSSEVKSLLRNPWPASHIPQPLAGCDEPVELQAVQRQ